MAQWLKYGIIFGGSFILLAEGRLFIHSLLESRVSGDSINLKRE